MFIALREAGPVIASEIGGKAANCARLLRAGFPVPAGVVVPASTSDADLVHLREHPWVAAQPEASRTWVPRYLRVGELPKTATGKVVVRQLSRERWDADGVWVRDGDTMRPLTGDDRVALEKAFADSGRPLL
jgi:acyl-CoA synthetase (AMP-forming)/AMP-acid ligase II